MAQQAEVITLAGWRVQGASRSVGPHVVVEVWEESGKVFARHRTRPTSPIGEQVFALKIDATIGNVMRAAEMLAGCLAQLETLQTQTEVRPCRTPNSETVYQAISKRAIKEKGPALIAVGSPTRD